MTRKYAKGAATPRFRRGTKAPSPIVELDGEAPKFKPNDPVNHPNHYTDGGIECIDAIRASMTTDEFRGMLKGNAMKYLWRYRLKGNPVQDLEKAAWYLNRLIELEKEDTHQ